MHRIMSMNKLYNGLLWWRLAENENINGFERKETIAESANTWNRAVHFTGYRNGTTFRF